MVTPAHDPYTCQCDHCRVEQILSDTGGWEWVDDGRPAQKPEPARRHWSWYVVDAMVLAWVVVLLILLVVFGG